MKRYPVEVFQSSGTWYTNVQVSLSDNAMPWHFMEALERELEGSLRGMTAVIIEAPWGYPALYKIPED